MRKTFEQIDFERASVEFNRLKQGLLTKKFTEVQSSIDENSGRMSCDLENDNCRSRVSYFASFTSSTPINFYPTRNHVQVYCDLGPFLIFDVSRKSAPLFRQSWLFKARYDMKERDLSWEPAWSGHCFTVPTISTAQLQAWCAEMETMLADSDDTWSSEIAT